MTTQAPEDVPPRWSLGILNDSETVDVPGSVRLLAEDHDEPLGLAIIPRRSSASTLPTGVPWGFADPLVRRYAGGTPPKKSKNGMILDPQPEESVNDPLNWPSWRRNMALLSVGLYSIVGGGLTPMLAAAFPSIANEFNIGMKLVGLTTGVYMLGLGSGSVLLAPTAILFGKRPVYLVGAVAVILCTIWCALAPTFTWLLVARFFQGLAVSPVECLPGATIGEIFFLHEKSFRIGIYTLLLLAGKNLVPLVSAVIVQGLDWRWVFWVMAMVLAFCTVLLFFFAPETFWDRKRVRRQEAPSWPSTLARRLSSAVTGRPTAGGIEPGTFSPPSSGSASGIQPASPRELEDMPTPPVPDKRDRRAHFADPPHFPVGRINPVVLEAAVAAAEDPVASGVATGSLPATAGNDAASGGAANLGPASPGARFVDLPHFPFGRIDPAVSEAAVAAAEDPVASGVATGSLPAAAGNDATSGGVTDANPTAAENAFGFDGAASPGPATPNGSPVSAGSLLGPAASGAAAGSLTATAGDDAGSGGAANPGPATPDGSPMSAGSVLDPAAATAQGAPASASCSVTGPSAATPQRSPTPSTISNTPLATPEDPTATGSIVDGELVTPEGSEGSEASTPAYRTLIPIARPSTDRYLVVRDGAVMMVSGDDLRSTDGGLLGPITRFGPRRPRPVRRATSEDSDYQPHVVPRDTARGERIDPNQALPSPSSRRPRFSPLISTQMQAYCDSLDGHVSDPAEDNQDPPQGEQQQNGEQAAQLGHVAQLEHNHPETERRGSRCLVCEGYPTVMPTIWEEGADKEVQQQLQRRSQARRHSSMSAPSPAGSTPPPRSAMELEQQRLALGMSLPTAQVGPVDWTGPFGPLATAQEGRTPRTSSTAALHNASGLTSGPRRQSYTTAMRGMPPRTFTQQLKPYNGRLSQDSWLHAALRPFVLLTYPAVLWAALVYACSMGWLVVLSQTVAAVFIEGSYQFTEVQMGLTYLSPFIGGILGTVVAGLISDVIVKKMARHNGGIYEPEFRLLMVLPVLITTVLGLIGFGWSAQAEMHWMVPTFFFGLISLGCSMGSTTAITFVVDSHRQYSGESLVALSLLKNLHGMVFSLFFMGWLATDGSQRVFLILGITHLALLLTAIPMYVFGKRARMWTVRKNYVERFWHA